MPRDLFPLDNKSNNSASLQSPTLGKMAGADDQGIYSKLIRQSPPVNVSVPYNPAWVRGKTILITGGASGIGAGLVRVWARNGATVIVGDINTEKSLALIQELRKDDANASAHFVHCNVTDWQSQVHLFKEAVQLSPHGGIDTVVANAGVSGGDPLQFPKDLSVAEPRQPEFKTVEVNFIGLLYTVHLAFYWLPKNPGSDISKVDSKPAAPRDRHLLLVGSMASMAPIPMAPQYGASKAAVLGLFRSLRATCFMKGIRINLLMPYFIDTELVATPARLLLAGGGMAKVDDVVDAATRLVADSRILGRALCVGPKGFVKQNSEGEWSVVNKDTPGGAETTIWEAYSEDWEEVDNFCRNMARVLNTVQATRGWMVWAMDVFGALGHYFKFGR